jgi:HD-GYP domain-containing protein (c-di-GMP phosphodiesterase class II)
MQTHSAEGARIVEKFSRLREAVPIIRHHHERWDGHGYPDGLAGEAIPLGSRVILACDAYHAMTSDRPYRARMSHQDAFTELTRCAGRQFDPDVTAALVGFFYNERAGRPLLTS